MIHRSATNVINTIKIFNKAPTEPTIEQLPKENETFHPVHMSLHTH